MKTVTILIVLMISSLPCTAQITDVTTFPLNDYLIAGNATNPYPQLNYAKFTEIDTTKLLNVMNFGAKGDGRTVDDNAIAAAFKNALYGVKFPAGRTFISSKTLTLTTNRNIIVWAYGATIKKAPLSRYSFLRVIYPDKGDGFYTGTFMWLGGAIDGDQAHQSWDGSPTGHNEWVEAAGQLLMVDRCDNVIYKDLTIMNSIINGTNAQKCRTVIIADSKGFGAAPLSYAEVAHQGAYFKVRAVGGTVSGTAFYLFNVDCKDGSMGIHYSTNDVEQESITVLNNCHVLNASRNPLHFEHCRRVFINNSFIEHSVQGTKQIHISNNTLVCVVKNSRFRNTALNFNNTSDLKLAIVDSCEFISEATTTSEVRQFIAGKATICTNSSFSGKTNNSHSAALNNRNNRFTNFGSVGIDAGYITDSCLFENGRRPVNVKTGGAVTKTNKFINVSNPNNLVTPSGTTWENIFKSGITFLYKK